MRHSPAPQGHATGKTDVQTPNWNSVRALSAMTDVQTKYHRNTDEGAVSAGLRDVLER